MKKILLFGAGKSASALIHYLKKLATERQWPVVVADAHLEAAKSKTGEHPFVTPVALQIESETERSQLIQQADIVISLLPPALHYLVALDCLKYGKNLLTASYIDDRIKALSADIADARLLFLCEMGLDPGIDHMSAMQLINNVKHNGYRITGFRSHCGGLVAPESDTNPWHYKISWNPRNVVNAGKAGAIYRENHQTIEKNYAQLFSENQEVNIPGEGSYAWYPNRDSLSYTQLYNLDDAATFIRTTLRHPDFCRGWNHIISLQLTNETPCYETDGLSLHAFLEQHLLKHQVKHLLPSDAKSLEQLAYLGFFSDTLINKGFCSAADILQWTLENKLALARGDKDMIIMLHELDTERDGKAVTFKSSLVVKGQDDIQTAMAKTVGLPLGIAAVLILDGVITTTGLQIPILPEIYQPVLTQLAVEGIRFKESNPIP